MTHWKLGACVGATINMLSACGHSTAAMSSAFFIGEMLGALVGGLLFGALFGSLFGYLLKSK